LDEHTLEVVTKSSSSMLVKIVGMVAALVVSVFLGRTLGASGLGIINLATQTTTILLVVTMLGMNNVLIKRIAIGDARGDSQEIANSVYTSSVINGLFATVITVLGILLTPWLARSVFHTQALEIPLIVSLAVIVPQTFTRIFAAGMNGFHKIWQSNLVGDTLGTCVIGLELLLMFFFHLPITVITVAILYAVSRLIVFCSTGLYWRRLFPFRGPRCFIPRPMLTMALPLLIATGAYAIAANAGGVMLGWLRTPREVGLYSVATKLALLESLFLMVSNSAIGPKLASLHSQERIRELETMVKRVTGGLILIAIASLAVLIAFGHSILNLWGKEFAGAYLALVILGIGQFFNISTGCSGMLLAMCGHEKTVGYLSTTFLLLNLVLNYFLISAWGAVGAATATAITVAGENTIKVFLTKWYIGVSTIPI
jgi:O-antigen/teichoic acid export membrane protein